MLKLWPWDASQQGHRWPDDSTQGQPEGKGCLNPALGMPHGRGTEEQGRISRRTCQAERHLQPGPGLTAAHEVGSKRSLESVNHWFTCGTDLCSGVRLSAKMNQDKWDMITKRCKVMTKHGSRMTNHERCEMLIHALCDMQ